MVDLRVGLKFGSESMKTTASYAFLKEVRRRSGSPLVFSHEVGLILIIAK